MNIVLEDSIILIDGIIKMGLKKKQIDLIYLVMIIALLSFMLFVIYYLITNKEAFIENPFIYGASSMEGDVYCSCYQTTSGQIFKFEFNKTNWWGTPIEQMWSYDE